MKNLLPKLTIGFFATMLVALSFLSMAASAQSSVPGCFLWTFNGTPIGTANCNTKANDITIFFKPGTNCFIVFEGTSFPCPKGANDIEVTWGVSSTGAPVITGCVWTKGGKPLTSVSCTVPPGSTSFIISNMPSTANTMTKVFWTLNGKRIGPVMNPPAGVIVNDVEFEFG